MSSTVNVRQIVQGGGLVFDLNAAYTSESIRNLIDALAVAIGTDKLINFNVDVSQLKVLLLYSTTAMTIETNSSSAADDTLTLAAGIPLVWTHDSEYACPLTVDVTALYLTNVAAAEFTALTLEDITP